VDEEDWYNMYCSTELKNLNEASNPGDVVFYYHTISVSGSKEAERTATVMEVHPEKDIPLWLSNNECLGPIKQIKVMNCGVLQNQSKGIYGHIFQFKLVKSGPPPGHKHKLMEAVRLEKIWDASAGIT
jgi:hypothetical protein